MFNVSHKHAIHDCAQEEQKDLSDKYKEAVTEFKIVRYDPSLNYSIIKCYPRTGRTHQIRVHLKSIGHPIENDMMYRTIYEVNKDLEKWKTASKENRVFHFKKDDKGVVFDIEDSVVPNIPSEEFDEIYLHAYKYKFGTYKFKTKLPDWAVPPDSIKSKETDKSNGKVSE